MIFRRSLLAALVAAGLSLGAASVFAQEKTITVFAAASMKNALDDVNAAFLKATGIKVVTSYAASSALARQIGDGAPADLFISADRDWMDYCAARKLIQEASRFDLVGNKLVLIAAKDAKIESMSLAPHVDLAALAGDRRIVTADVRAVPAGRYAKAALESLGIWSSVEKKLAMVENVRAALALVARGEAALGIVYATDARVEPGVKVVGEFPEGSHPPIVYPAALTATAQPQAEAFRDYLRSAAAKAVFERYGFTVLVQPSS